MLTVLRRSKLPQLILNTLTSVCIFFFLFVIHFSQLTKRICLTITRFLSW